MFVEAATGAALAAACAGRDGWDEPAPPARIHGNTYYVGTCGISAVLITSPQGHVLIDGGTERGGPLIAANVERLGFRLRDVKWILSSHEHFDHVGGLTALQARTGARFAALAGAAPVFASGRSAADDPQTGALRDFPAVRIQRALRHGDTVRIGPIRVTVHATPGHAPFGTSWTWASCEGRTCRTIAYADSISAISADGYRYTDNPERVRTFRAAMTRIAALPCDILVTPHPSGSNLFARLASQAPLMQPGACRTYAAQGIANLDVRLGRERAGR